MQPRQASLLGRPIENPQARGKDRPIPTWEGRGAWPRINDRALGCGGGGIAWRARQWKRPDIDDRPARTGDLHHRDRAPRIAPGRGIVADGAVEIDVGSEGISLKEPTQPRIVIAMAIEVEPGFLLPLSSRKEEPVATNRLGERSADPIGDLRLAEDVVGVTLHHRAR